jgi:hypothetical protein
MKLSLNYENMQMPYYSSNFLNINLSNFYNTLNANKNELVVSNSVDSGISSNDNNKDSSKESSLSISNKKFHEYTLANRHSYLISKFNHNNNNNNNLNTKHQQIGTFLTQYKIRENFKFLQMFEVPPLDPAVPKPEGGISIPAAGEPLCVPQSFPQSIEAAIHKFANASSKATCITVLDQFGKATASLTYGNTSKS